MAVLADLAARKLLHGASAQGVAAGMSLGLDVMLQLVADLFASLVHLFVLPFQATGHAIQWFFAGVVAGLGGAARLLVLPLETLGRWLQAAVAGIASAAPLLVLPFEAFWRWLRDAAAAALPYVLAIVAVVCVVALLWLSCTFLCSAAALIGPPLAGAAITCWALRLLFPAAVRTGQALVYAVCYAAKGVGVVLAWALPRCGRCCVVLVAMKAPGAAGMVISRGAFESLPQLYFLILRSAGAVFCARPVAWVFAAPVAALFRAL